MSAAQLAEIRALRRKQRGRRAQTRREAIDGGAAAGPEGEAAPRANAAGPSPAPSPIMEAGVACSHSPIAVRQPGGHKKQSAA